MVNPVLGPSQDAAAPAIAQTSAPRARRARGIAFRWAPLALGGSILLASCGSGGGSVGSVKGTSGDFVVLRTEPQNNGRLFLNESISIDFSNEIDLTTADLNSITFAVFDLNGVPLSEQPAGTFRLEASPGDATIGRRLEFAPRLPSNDTYDNGGLRPGRRYLVQLVGGDQRNNTTLRDVRGKGLARATTFEFSTADGTTPSELFSDTKVGGPRRLSFTVTPSTPEGVPLNLLGQQPLEIRLGFDQPLNPNSANVPVAFDTNILRRDIARRGRIYLEYDDPDPTRGRNTWIPADVDLEINNRQGSTVVLRPVGVLPNNANVRVIVENTLQDMSGESNVSDAAYDRVFAEFRTREDYEPQFDAIVEEFDANANIDFAASFVEPVAEVTNGIVRSNFEFEGSATILDYEPQTREIVLNTDFTQITPKGAPPINVVGGVFQFRNVTIPRGVTVRGTGTRPMVWLVTGDFIVRGELTVRGGDGARVDTLNSANFPTPGGIGACGGGNGGRGSPRTDRQSESGESGNGPFQVAGGGGSGGQVSARASASCGRGSGGGGGSFATQGDPNFKAKAATGSSSFIQQRGVGGYGCQGGSGAATRSLPGGNPGPLAFTDARLDNNFWGSGVNISRQIRITGELPAPIGGQGGGGGGDQSTSLNNPNWIQDPKGGGGGAGGGIIIIKCLGKIIVESDGIIRADGGNGGGGEQAGGNNLGGGGGAGAGGMVVLMSGTAIELHTHGETYANGAQPGAYLFAVSADGGIGTQARYGGTEFLAKYPPLGTGASYDANPTGAMGGMGVVQLMAPAGTNTDGTNTVLDDNVKIIRGGVELAGTEKQRYIAWRGIPNANGRFVDDAGNETYHHSPSPANDAEGDIRPAPILLPAPFGPKSRLRSTWIDTGASVRRALTANDGAARGIVEDATNGFLAGPTYSFTGTNNEVPTPTRGFRGYVDYEQDGAGGVRVKLPPPVVTSNVLALAAQSSFAGQPAYVVDLTDPALGTTPNRWAQYQALLENASGTTVGEYRILGNSDRRLFLYPGDGQLVPFTAGMKVSVVAKFFQIGTDGAPGFGRTTTNANNQQVPTGNVQIGFAFHKDPSRPSLNGPGTEDANRLPARLGTYMYDLTDPAVQETVRQFSAPYVQWDLLFNSRFTENPATGNTDGRTLSPTDARPELRWLRIPFRF